MREIRDIGERERDREREMRLERLEREEIRDI